MTDTTQRGLVSRGADLATDVAALAGALSIIHGVDLIYRPAAFIVAGVFALGASWIYARKVAV